MRLALLLPLLLAACASAPSQPTSPLAFTRQVYANYEHANPRFKPATVYSQHLRNLTANYRGTDPLCNCPGPAKTKAFKLIDAHIAIQTKTGPKMHVTFENGSTLFRQSTDQTLQIIRENDQYRINEITYPNGTTFSESLQ